MNRFYTIALIVFSLLLSYTNSHAQISFGGQPYTLNHPTELPVFVQPNPYELQFKATTESKDCGALEFGRFLSIHKNINDGDWQKIETNENFTIYRLAVYSPEALAVGVYFSDFDLPTGAKLFVYTPDYQQIKGAFTEKNNRASALFAVEYVLGDRLIIEYQEPKDAKTKAHIVLSEVLHAYRDVSFDNTEKSFGDAGDCEVNVNCPESEGWERQRDAVLRLLIKKSSSASWCSGSLINNTNQDLTPYVLTADHCGKLSPEENHALWLFYFNYQSEDCENPLFEPELKSMLGCEQVAASSNADILGSDFYLVKLLDDIPDEYHPYFAGWNIENIGSFKGFGIHHPQGDIKKISHYTTTLQDATYSNGLPNAHWQVFWSETESGHGVTEGGSSGSPIFNHAGYLVGTLTGGQASCTNLEAPDYYGKMSSHWQENGIEENQQLQPWLDPTNTGILQIGGMYLGIEDNEMPSDILFGMQPNPSSSILNLHFHKNYQDYKITISDISGKQLYSHLQGNTDLKIDISFLKVGIYFVGVQSESQKQVLKLLKM